MSNDSEEAKRVLKDIVNENNTVVWSDFTIAMLDAVIIESKSEADLKKLKRVWKSLFITISKNLNINVDDKNDNWSLVEEKILSSRNTNNNTRSSRSSTRSSRPTNPHSKSSESSSQLNEMITDKEKEEVLDMYKQLDESKLWKLSTGKIVEKEMMKLVEEAIYEHPCHSFIFDPEDDNWNEYFSEEELTEIRTHKCKKVPELPKELVEFFDSINQGDIDDLYKSISDVYYHPVRDYVCHWAKKCFLEGIQLFMSEFFKGDDFTERDLLSRVWRLILLAFDKGELKIREKKYSKATNTQINRKRKLSSIESIERKVTSKRPDQLITFGDYELGIVEGSKIDDDHSTKLFLDSMKKSPKSMKDMLLQLLKVAPHKKHDIKTIALITSRLEIQMMTMDLPESYVFRVERTETFKYPNMFSMFVKDIRNCLEITWLSRKILEETVAHLTSPAPHVSIGFKQKKHDDLPPTFYSKKHN